MDNHTLIFWQRMQNTWYELIQLFSFGFCLVSIYALSPSQSRIVISPSVHFYLSIIQKINFQFYLSLLTYQKKTITIFCDLPLELIIYSPNNFPRPNTKNQSINIHVNHYFLVPSLNVTSKSERKDQYMRYSFPHKESSANKKQNGQCRKDERKHNVVVYPLPRPCKLRELSAPD